MRRGVEVFFIFVIGLLIYGRIQLDKTSQIIEIDTAGKVVREPAVAGTWYPGSSDELAKTVDSFLENAEKASIEGKVRAIIVPHAGYVYSGQVAAYAFKQISDDYDTVLLMGPSHHYPLRGASIFNVTHYRTPLGDIKLSKKATELLSSPIIASYPEAHEKEHSLEIELPFVQESLGDVSIVPILVGDTNPFEFAGAIEKYVGDHTLIVASSDLSHYLDYDTGVKKDNKTINAILHFDYDYLTANWDCACGRIPIMTLMKIAGERGWQPRLIKYANSGDITGDKSSVVGYAAIVFTSGEGLKKEERADILKLARQTLDSHVKKGEIPEIDGKNVLPSLQRVQGCFVTLNKNGKLRGCIGHILPKTELYKCVIENTVNAAIHDRRFTPVTKDELDDIEVEVSVLSVPERLEFDSGEDLCNKLVPERDGVVLKSGMHQSTYLPQVWEQIPGKEDFLSNLCMKAGMSANCWQDIRTEVYTYRAEVFHEGAI